MDLHKNLTELGIEPSKLSEEPKDHIAFLIGIMHGLITGIVGGGVDLERQKAFFMRHSNIATIFLIKNRLVNRIIATQNHPPIITIHLEWANRRRGLRVAGIAPQCYSAARATAALFSILTAQNLNSGILPMGSS